MRNGDSNTKLKMFPLKKKTLHPTGKEGGIGRDQFVRGCMCVCPPNAGRSYHVSRHQPSSKFIITTPNGGLNTKLKMV